MAFTDFIQIWNSFYELLKSPTHCWTENRGKLAYIVFIIIEGTFTKVVRLILVNYRKNLTSQLIKNWRRFLTSGLNVMLWRRGGLMVSALDSGSGGPSSSPGQGHCVVFLGKTLYIHSPSLHPGVQMGTSKCAGGNIPSRGEYQYS